MRRVKSRGFMTKEELEELKKYTYDKEDFCMLENCNHVLERIKERNNRRYAENKKSKESKQSSYNKYYEEHTDERKEYYRKHYKENKEARQQYYKEYYIKKKTERKNKNDGVASIEKYKTRED